MPVEIVTVRGPDALSPDRAQVCGNGKTPSAGDARAIEPSSHSCTGGFPRRINGDNLQAIYDAIFAHHWIMDHLNYRMMPTDQMMQMQR